MTDLKHILIFKTNIETEADKQLIEENLNKIYEIKQWNIAQDDCDRVLRIVSTELKQEEIIKIINGIGYQCAALE